MGPRLAEALAESGVRIAVAEAGGAMHGWATYGTNRDADADPWVGELRSLFVHPNAWRQGVGRALMEFALGELGAMGYREATVWSLAGNARANAFYEAHGFARDGAEQSRPVFLGAGEVRYRRTLA
jgi:GNAT superfamily N-acetyltransferase